MSGPDLFVQSLVASRNGNPTARWNFPAVVGSRLGSSAGVGTAVTLSYGFLDAAPRDYSWGTGFQTLSTAYRQAAGRALQILSSVARISFTAAADASTARIRFGRNSQPAGQGAFTWLPGYGYSFNPATGTILSVTESPSGGDVWLNNSIVYSNAELNPGAEGLATLVHELAHAVGLRHPFETPNPLSAAYENQRFTVMSYTPAARSSRVDLRLTGGGGYSYTSYALQPRSLMLGDIAALQFLYGANNSFNAGNNSYRYTDSDLFLETIWDGGGKDTIDCSALSYTCLISLEAGTFSSIGLRRGEAQLRELHNIPADISISDPSFWSDLYDGSNNLAIAYSCRIENCIGSKANDQITGNSLANQINGRAGADTLNGQAGTDALTGGKGVDRFLYRALSDSGVGAAQRDVITDFQGDAGETIDLSRLDAFSGAGGNQDFLFIGGAGFSGQRGEVRFASGILQINTGLDKHADMEIELQGLSSFRSEFLVL